MNGLRLFDYGPEKNMELYNTVGPPEYDLSSIKTPIAAYAGENDFFCTRGVGEGYVRILGMRWSWEKECVAYVVTESGCCVV